MTSPSMPRTGTHRVTGVDAPEILDSRGRPTLQVTVAFGDGTTATARGAVRGLHGQRRKRSSAGMGT